MKVTEIELIEAERDFEFELRHTPRLRTRLYALHPRSNLVLARTLLLLYGTEETCVLIDPNVYAESEKDQIFRQ